jgi:hypothetical protein
MGENASRMMCPSSGFIHSGRDAWSDLRCSHEKSWSMKMCEIILFCCCRCLASEEPSPASLAICVRRSSASLRVNAVKLMVADFGTMALEEPAAPSSTSE